MGAGPGITRSELTPSFTPINQIHQHLCGLHVYAEDPKRQVKAHHFCTHLRKNLHQCVIYDSDAADARLIGIEYLIPEKEFTELPEDEKKVCCNRGMGRKRGQG